MSITPQKRSILQHLVNTKFPFKTGDTPEFHLVNEGVTELTESFNADTEDLQYIAEDQATSVVKKYAPSISLSAVMVKGDEVNTWIQKVINKLPVGEGADTEYIRFSLLDTYSPSGGTSTDKSYKAVKKSAVVSVDSIGGGAGENIEMSVNLSGKGDPKYGYVTISEGSDSKKTYTFTEKNDIFDTTT